MRYQQYAPAVPTRTTLRRTAARTTDAVRGYAAGAIVVCVALATFVAGGAALVVALAAVAVALPAHPLGLLATVAVTTVGVYTLPLVAVRAATRVVAATTT